MASTRYLRPLALSVLLLAGVTASLYGGYRLRGQAREVWLQRATREAERNTNTALFWLSLYHAQMRGFGAVFHSSSEVTEDELLDALAMIEAVEAAIPLTSLAFVVEGEAGDREIVLSTDLEGDLAPGSQLVSAPAVALTVARTLERYGNTMMGPVLEGSAGRRLVPLGLAAPNAGTEGVLLALVDLGSFCEGLDALHISDGLKMRIEEEHRWPGVGLRRRSITGDADAPAEAVETVSIVGRSGEAEWEFHWDVLPTYRGGPQTGLADVVQYGGLGSVALAAAVIALLLAQNRQVNRRVEERTRELRRARDEAGERERDRQRILATTDQGFIRLDRQGVATEANDAMCRILGLERQNVVGRPTTDFLDEENAATLLQQLERRRLGEAGAYELSVLRDDGTQVPCLITATPLVDEAGQVLGSFALVTDITERKREEVRRQAVAGVREAVWHLDSTSGPDELIRALFEGMKVLGAPVWAVAINRVDGEQTPPAVTVYSLDELGHEMAEPIHPDHAPLVIEFWCRGEVAYRRDLQNDDSLAERETFRQKPRSVIDMPFSHGTLALNSLVPNAFDDYLEVLEELAEVLSEGFRRLEDLKALGDRTLRAEEAQREAEAANQSKSAFLANISHEIRTPMNAILGFTDILAGSVTEPQQRGYAHTIQESGKALLSLINDLLDLSRVEAGALKLTESVVDVGALMDEVRRVFTAQAERKGLDLRIDVATGVPPALIMDGGRLRQILLNLVGNAVKFTERGHVELTLSAVAMEGSEEADLTVTVRDTGIGIPDEDQERIFGAFTQRSGQSINEYGGTGMGLTVTRSMVELMGGRVSVASQVGVGSTFTVALPGVRIGVGAVEAPAAGEADPEHLQFAPATILVADDVETSRELVRAYLTPYGLRILEAADGQEAIEITLAERPDAVLMDIKMPVLDGFTAARRMKANPELQAIPIVALTASVMKESEAEIEALCDAFVRKPVSKGELVRALMPFLDHATQDGGEVAVGAEAGAPDAEEMSDEARARLPELIAELESRTALWEELRATQTINDVEDFARQVQELGEAFGYPPLRVWGERLAVEASTFDMVAMPTTMEEFPQIVEEARALVAA